MIQKSLNFSLIILIFLGFVACSDDSDAYIIPNVYVREEVVLSNQEALPLRFDGGVIYISGGVRGLMIYKQNATTYRAYDRACPNNPSASCELLKADISRVFMQDSCCGSQFSWEGTYMGGPAKGNPREYATAVVSGGRLLISNTP